MTGMLNGSTGGCTMSFYSPLIMLIDCASAKGSNDSTTGASSTATGSGTAKGSNSAVLSA